MKLYIDSGYSIKEIAETMKVSVDNVYTIKHRAIKKLKTYLQERI